MMSNLRAAWQYMLALRTCPPQGTACLWSSLDADETVALGAALPQVGDALATPSPAPGQIWALHKHLGAWWRPGRYINPPLVVILELLPPESLWVAQLFDAPEFAGPGDISLGEGLGFAEAWNTSVLPTKALGRLCGEVAAKELAEVRAAAQIRHEVPEDSPLAALRLLEEDVAQFMVLRARLGAEDTLHALRRTLHRLSPHLKTPEDTNPLRALAAASLPPELVAVAAADNDCRLPYTHVVLGQEHGMPCAGFFATEHQRRLDGDIIRITGTLDPAACQGMLYAWWQHGPTIIQGSCHLDPQTRMFRADFPGHSKESFLLGRPMLLLVSDASHARHT